MANEFDNEYLSKNKGDFAHRQGSYIIYISGDKTNVISDYHDKWKMNRMSEELNPISEWDYDEETNKTQVWIDPLHPQSLNIAVGLLRKMGLKNFQVGTVGRQDIVDPQRGRLKSRINNGYYEKETTQQGVSIPALNERSVPPGAKTTRTDYLDTSPQFYKMTGYKKADV